IAGLGLACVSAEAPSSAVPLGVTTALTTLGEVTAVPPPAAPGSGEPNLFAAADGRVFMSWLEPVGGNGGPPASTRHGRFALRFAVLEGGSWSAPRTIAGSDAFFVNWADFPSLVALPGGGLAAHWLARSGQGSYAYDVKISRSGDGGATWAAPVTPHRDGAPTEHGFVSLVPEPDGGFTAVWLDGRNFAVVSSGKRERSSRRVEMTLRSATFDAAGNQGPEHLLDARICDCCQTSAARVGDDLLVVYRDRSVQEVRDIWAVTRGPAGWEEPVRVADDSWKIPGCPVNGPAVAANGDTAAVAWFSLRQGRPEVKVTFTSDGGRSFSDAILVDAGEPERSTAGATSRPRVPLGRVDVEWIDGRTAVVSWLSARGRDAEIRILAVGLDGTRSGASKVGETRSSRASGFPRMVRAGDRLVLAWTLPGHTSAIRTVTVPILAH
ncbi:MAG: sialidase family protein, partial [Acidobacteriota bacterium]